MSRCQGANLFRHALCQQGCQQRHVTATYTASTGMGSTIHVNGSAVLTTEFLKSPVSQLNFNTGKIGALQTASRNLIDQLSASAQTAETSISRSSISRSSPLPTSSILEPASRTAALSTGATVGHGQHRGRQEFQFPKYSSRRRPPALAITRQTNPRTAPHNAGRFI